MVVTKFTNPGRSLQVRNREMRGTFGVGVGLRLENEFAFQLSSRTTHTSTKSSADTVVKFFRMDVPL